MPFVTIAALIVAAFVLISLFLWASFVSASPGEVKVISGPRGTIISNPFQRFQRSYLPAAPSHGLVTRE